MSSSSSGASSSLAAAGERLGVAAIAVTYDSTMAPGGFHRLVSPSGTGVKLSSDGTAVYLWYKLGAATPSSAVLADLRVVYLPEDLPAGYTLVPQNLVRSGPFTAFLAYSTVSPASADASATVTAIVELRVVTDAGTASQLAASAGWTLLQEQLNAGSADPVRLAFRRAQVIPTAEQLISPGAQSGAADSPYPSDGADSTAGAAAGSGDAAGAPPVEEWSAAAARPQDRIDAQDKYGNWLTGTVQANEDGHLVVLFDAWSAAEAESIPISSNRLAAPDTKTKAQNTAANRGASGMKWRSSLERLSEMSQRVQAAIHDPASAPDSFMSQWLPTFVESCLMSRHDEMREEEAIAKFLQEVVTMVSTCLQSSAALHVSCLRLLTLLFNGDTGCGYWFRMYGYGLAPRVDVTQGLVATNPRPATSSYAYATQYVNSYYYPTVSTPRPSSHLLHCINRFNQSGGLAAIVSRFLRGVTADTRDVQRISVFEAQALLDAISLFKTMLVKEFWEDYWLTLRLAALERLRAIADEEVKDVDPTELDGVFQVLVELASAAEVGDIHEASERTRVEHALQLLACSTLQHRVRGVTALTDLVDITENAAIQSRARKAKWLTPSWLADRLTQFDVVGMLLGTGGPSPMTSPTSVASAASVASTPSTKCHPEVIKRGVAILSFLAKYGGITGAHVRQLWALMDSKDPNVTATASSALTSVVARLPASQQGDFYEQIKRIPLTQYDVATIELIHQFAFNVLQSQAYTSTEAYGLSQLWAALQDDAPVTASVATAAESSLVRLLRHVNARHHLRQYLEVCITNLKAGRSVGQSLSIARLLLDTFPVYSSYGVASRASVIREMEHGSSLPKTLLDELVSYKTAALAAAATLCNVSCNTADRVGTAAAVRAVPAMGVGTCALVGKYPHLQAISSRLEFLKYVVGVAGPLDTPALAALWTACIEEALCEEEAARTAEWLISTLPPERPPVAYNYGMYGYSSYNYTYGGGYGSQASFGVDPRIISLAARDALFGQLARADRGLCIAGMAGFRLYRTLFRFVNISAAHIKLSTQRTAVTRGENPIELSSPLERLLGMEQFWELSRQQQSVDVAAAARAQLIALHLLVRTNRQQAWAAFAKKCASYLDAAVKLTGESRAGAAANVVALMSAFVEQLQAEAKSGAQPPAPAPTSYASAVSPARPAATTTAAAPSAFVNLTPVSHPGVGEFRLQLSLTIPGQTPVAHFINVPDEITVGELREMMTQFKPSHAANAIRLKPIDLDALSWELDELGFREVATYSVRVIVTYLAKPEADTSGHQNKHEPERAGGLQGGAAGVDMAEIAVSMDDDELWLQPGAGWASLQQLSAAILTSEWGSPMRELAASPAVFSRLYDDLLDDSQPTALTEQVWQLLQQLPPSPDLLEKIRSIRVRDILESTSRGRLLYAMQLIELQLWPATDRADDGTAAAYRRSLIANEGAAVLVRTLMQLDIHLWAGSPLGRAALSLLVKLVAYLVGISTGTAQAILVLHTYTPDDVLRRTLDILELVSSEAGQTANAYPPAFRRSTSTTSAAPAAAPAPASDASKPPAAVESVEACTVRWCYLMMSKLLALGGPIAQRLVRDKAKLHRALTAGVLEARQAPVRDEAVRGFLRLCQALHSLHCDAIEDTAWHHVLAMLDRVYTYPTQNDQFFVLLEALAKSGVRRGSLHAPDLCRLLVRRLQNHPVVEISRFDQDFVLRGLFRLLTVLVSSDPATALSTGADLQALRANVASLIPHLFETGLFAVPIVDGNVHPPPLCKNPVTRQHAFKLLESMVSPGDGHYVRLLRLCAGLHSIDAEGADIGGGGQYQLDAEPELKAMSGYVGISNPRNVCYLITCLQQFFHVMPFREGVLAFTAPGSDERSSMMYQLQRLYEFMQESDDQCVDPRPFCAAFRDSDGHAIDISQQRDASEFVMSFFQQVEIALSGTPWEGLLQNCFGGQFLHTLDADGRHSERTEEFYLISVNVKGMQHLHNALNDFISGEEVSYGWETDRKDGAGKPVLETLNTTKRQLLHVLPRTLVIHLKRFSFDFESMSNTKVNDRFQFPNILDMYAFTSAGAAANTAVKPTPAAEPSSKSPEEEAPQAPVADDVTSSPTYRFDRDEVPEANVDHLYRLSGVVVHRGTATSGHYYSLIRDRSARGISWYRFDDRVVTPFDVSDIEPNSFGGKVFIADAEDMHGKQLEMEQEENAFMLIYDRVSDVTAAADAHDKPEESVVTHPIVPAPPVIRAEVLEANRELWLRRYIMDPAYLQFLNNLLAQLPASPSHHLLRDTPEFFESGATSASSSETVTSATAGLLQVQLRLRVILATLLRCKNKAALREWTNKCVDIVNDNVPAAAWVVRKLAGLGSQLRELVTVVDSVEIRESMTALLAAAAKVLTPVELAGGHIPAGDACSLMVLSIAVQLLPEALGRSSTGDQLVQLVASLSRLPQLREWFGKYQLLTAAVAAMSGDVAGATAALQPEGKAVDVDERAAGVPNKALWLDVVSNVIGAYAPPSGVPMPGHVGTARIPSAVIERLACSSVFEQLFNACVQTGQGSSSAMSAQEMVILLCWENKQMSGFAIEVLNREIELRDDPALNAAFRFADLLFQLNDKLAAEWRLDALLSSLLNTIMVQQRYSAPTELCLDYISRLIENTPAVARILAAKPAYWEWVPPFLQTRPTYASHKPLPDGRYNASMAPSGVSRTMVLNRFKTLGHDSLFAAYRSTAIPVTVHPAPASVVRPATTTAAATRVAPHAAPPSEETIIFPPNTDPLMLIGRRVAVKWLLHGQPKWYSGVITRYLPGDNKHEVRYDDNDLKTYDLSTRAVCLL